MGVKSVYERIMEDTSRQRNISQERLILETTECIWRILETNNITKTELADRLGKSKPFVTQVLDGSRNMTIRTFADFLFALGYTVRLVERPLKAVTHDFRSNSFMSKNIGLASSYSSVNGDYIYQIGQSNYNVPQKFEYRQEQLN